MNIYKKLLVIFDKTAKLHRSVQEDDQRDLSHLNKYLTLEEKVLFKTCT